MRLGNRWTCGLLLLALGCGPGEVPVTAPEETPAFQESAPIEAFAAGDSEWVRTTSGGEQGSGWLVRGDALGNSYAAIVYEAGTRLGGVALPGAGVALVSHSPAGSMRWVRAFTCTQPDALLRPGALWVTPGGRSLLVLNGACTVDAGGGPLTGRNLLVAVGLDGQHRWSRVIVPLTSSNSLPEPDVTVSPTTNEVLVSGNVHGPVTAEGTPYTPSSPSSALLLRYSDRGAFLGARELDPPAGALAAIDVAYDGAGRLLALFSFAGTVDLGRGPRVAPQGASSILVARFTPAGRLLWDYTLAGSILPRALATAGTRVVVVGEFTGSVRFRGQTYTAVPGGPGARGEQGFVVALTRAGGTERWLRLRGRHIDDVAMDNNGGVTVIGRFSGLGPEPTPSDSATFVAKYDRTTGRDRWRRVLDFGGVLASVGTTGGGRPLVSGQFGGTADLGTGLITAVPADTIQAFVLRLSP